jgi:hypothetical protein
MLMGMGSLASVAAQRPDNLSIAIFDNARFGETGAQRSHTAYSTDLVAVASACGWRDTAQARTMAEVEALAPRLRQEPLFAVIKISADEVPRFLPPRDGAQLASRFRRAIGVPEP